MAPTRLWKLNIIFLNIVFRGFAIPPSFQFMYLCCSDGERRIEDNKKIVKRELRKKFLIRSKWILFLACVSDIGFLLLLFGHQNGRKLILREFDIF
jgi:hypothetical protein